jgi:hypothetical protein
MIVFSPREAYFYCPDGLLTESICVGDDRNQSLQFQSTDRVESIRLCAFLHQKRDSMEKRPATIEERCSQYRDSYLLLLDAYLGRILTYETDILNAFLGIIHAQSRTLGNFRLGMPLALFGRALLLSVRYRHGPCSRRPGFPSWSWIGWKCARTTTASIQDIPRPDNLDTLHTLVHIYALNDLGQLILLFGPRDDANGIEGYDSHYIDFYNQLNALEPLPLYPSLTACPSLPVYDVNPLHILIFRAHVARIPPTDYNLSRIYWQYGSIASTEWREIYDDSPIEVILIAMAINPGFPNDDKAYYGIVVERHCGYARRIGITDPMRRKYWLSGSPQLELIRLI